MDSATQRELAASFERGARGYATSRPEYPAGAVHWLVGSAPCDVLDIGAGTGSLTLAMARLGHRVVATDPSAAMLAAVQQTARGVSAVRCAAEALPFRPASFDVATVATAFHWLDASLALPEMSAALRPGGRLGLVWNTRVEDGGWPALLGELLRGAQPAGLSGDWGADSAVHLIESRLFANVERADFAFTQTLHRDELLGLVASRSYVIALDEQRRTRLFAAVSRLFDDAGSPRGASGRAVATRSTTRATTPTDVDQPGPTVELPYVARCWRATALPR